MSETERKNPPNTRHLAAFQAIKRKQRIESLLELKTVIDGKADEKVSRSIEVASEPLAPEGGTNKKRKRGKDDSDSKKEKKVKLTTPQDEKVNALLKDIVDNMAEEEAESGFKYDDSKIQSLIKQIQASQSSETRDQLYSQLVLEFMDRGKFLKEWLAKLQDSKTPDALGPADQFILNPQTNILRLRNVPFKDHPAHFDRLIQQLQTNQDNNNLKWIDFSGSTFSDEQFAKLLTQLAELKQLRRLKLRGVKLSADSLKRLQEQTWKTKTAPDLDLHDTGAPEVETAALMFRATREVKTTRDIPPKPLRVLAMDGGGTKGVTERAILEIWDQELKKRKPDGKITDLFDIVIGTSTGGFITGGLARNLPLSKIRDIFFEVAEKIFGSKPGGGWNTTKNFIFTGGKGYYDTGALEKIIETEVDGRNYFIGKVNPTDKTVPVSMGVATCKVNLRMLSSPVTRFWENFDTYESKDRQSRVRVSLLEALRSTSAAPSYFDLEKINGDSYTDGGVGANNPVGEFLLEYIDTDDKPIIKPNQRLHIISLGCGHSSHEETRTWDPMEAWVNYLTETQETHLEVEGICKTKNWPYLRLNLPASPDGGGKLIYWGDLDLATSQRSVLEDMERAATAYAESERTVIGQHVDSLLS